MHVILQHQVPIGSQCPWSNLSSLSTPSRILEPRNFEEWYQDYQGQNFELYYHREKQVVFSDCYCNQTTSAGNIIQNLRRKGSMVCICRDDIDSYRCYSTVSNPWVSLEACLDRSTRPSYPPGGSSTCGLETKNCDVSHQPCTLEQLLCWNTCFVPSLQVVPRPQVLLCAKSGRAPQGLGLAGCTAGKGRIRW